MLMRISAGTSVRRTDGDRSMLPAATFGVVSFAAMLLSRTLLTFLTSLLFWSVAPTLGGWSSQVVVSGSMMPRIAAGDVVVSQPVDGDTIQPGQVVLVENPAKPGTLLMHRMVERLADGSMITRGDANKDVDSTPVPSDGVRGLPSIRIPYIGLPVVWLNEGRYLPLALTVLILIAALYLCVDQTSERASAPQPEPQPAERDVSELQTAELDLYELQTAELDMSEPQTAELDLSELQRSDPPPLVLRLAVLPGQVPESLVPPLARPLPARAPQALRPSVPVLEPV